MESHRIRLRQFALAVGLSLAATIGSAELAGATTILGGVDMQGACNEQYPAYGLRAVVTDQHNAFSWRCTSPWGYSVGIDVNRECRVQYGSGAYSVLLNASDPYSWRCGR
jgi:hypothetical protein